MSTNIRHGPFMALLSDEVFEAGVLASDAHSLCERLAGTSAVHDMRRFVPADPDGIRELCRFVEALVDQSYDLSYRHPDDMAICAGLVVLASSPLPDARDLIVRMRQSDHPSLIWVRRLADHLNEQFGLPAHDVFHETRR